MLPRFKWHSITILQDAQAVLRIPRRRPINLRPYKTLRIRSIFCNPSYIIFDNTTSSTWTSGQSDFGTTKKKHVAHPSIMKEGSCNLCAMVKTSYGHGASGCGNPFHHWNSYSESNPYKWQSWINDHPTYDLAFAHGTHDACVGSFIGGYTNAWHVRFRHNP